MNRFSGKVIIATLMADYPPDFWRGLEPVNAATPELLQHSEPRPTMPVSWHEFESILATISG